MRIIGSIAAAVAMACLSGCGDGAAREYAKQLAATLDAYQQKVGVQINEQQKGYEKIARVLSESSEQDLMGALDTERLELVTKLRDSSQSESKTRFHFDATGLRGKLMAYARHDFEIHKAKMTEEADIYKRFLVGIADLQQDKAKLKILAGVLKDLSEKRSVIDRAKELAAFGKDVKTNIDKLECDGLAAQVKDLEAAKKALDDEIKNPKKPEDAKVAEKAKEHADTQISNIKTQMKEKNCKGA